MRDSWKDDSTLVAVKSGSGIAHADAGSFIVFHSGSPAHRLGQLLIWTTW